MRTQTTTPNYLQIAESIHKLSDTDKKKLFAEINAVPKKTAEKSPYNPEFVKMIQESRKGKFISMKEYQDLWK